MSANPFSAIQRPVTSFRTPSRRTLSLPVEQIAPVIRIAHTLASPLHIAPRIIFDHEFVLIHAGTGTLKLGALLLPFRPHDLFFIPPFIPHHFASTQAPGAHSAVHFDFHPRIPPASGAHRRLGTRRPYQLHLTAGLAIPPHTRLSRGHRLAAAFEHLTASFQTHTPLGTLEATADLLAIIAQLLRAATPEPAATRTQLRLDRAITHIHSHLAQSHSVPQLARIAGLSPSHFAASFRLYTGYSPLDYVRRQRVVRARQLLANVDLSIKEIAQEVGFDDAYHFSRVFRHVDGLAPSHYREALLASSNHPRPPLPGPS